MKLPYIPACPTRHKESNKTPKLSMESFNKSCVSSLMESNMYLKQKPFKAPLSCQHTISALFSLSHLSATFRTETTLSPGLLEMMISILTPKSKTLDCLIPQVFYSIGRKTEPYCSHVKSHASTKFHA